MGNKLPVKTYGKIELSHVDLAIQMKKLLNDIIEVAFKDSVSPKMLGLFKRFTVFCTEAQLKSKLGDCWHNKDGSSCIRILKVGRQSYQDNLILALHEVSHHVEKSLHGKSGHGAEFYRIHKALLYAAFDMGVLTVDDVIYSESTARNRDKLAGMMNDYVPHPIAYKADTVHIFVYHSFDYKDILKSRGYKWNKLDAAWTKELQAQDLEAEKTFLLSLGLSENDIKHIKGGAVVTRLKKSIKLFNVPKKDNYIVKKLGYRWFDGGKRKYWQKKVDGNSIPDEERSQLEAIEGIFIVVD